MKKDHDGIILERVDGDKFALYGMGIVAMTGTQTEVVRAMIRAGVEDDEIVLGLMEIEGKERSYYGIKKRFLFSE